MAIPSIFFEADDWKPLNGAVQGFGEADDASEDDLMSALRAAQLWRSRFTDASTFNFHGELITWRRHEFLVWTLGESFRRIMIRTSRLQGCACVFDAVRSLCFDQQFGKGRQSFTMLLGQYGGPAQIPALIQLLDDPEICGQAIYSLRLLGASETADRIRPYLDSPKAWIRKAAVAFFQKLGHLESRTEAAPEPAPAALSSRIHG